MMGAVCAVCDVWAEVSHTMCPRWHLTQHSAQHRISPSRACLCLCSCSVACPCLFVCLRIQACVCVRIYLFVCVLVFVPVYVLVLVLVWQYAGRCSHEPVRGPHCGSTRSTRGQLCERSSAVLCVLSVCFVCFLCFVCVYWRASESLCCCCGCCCCSVESCPLFVCTIVVRTNIALTVVLFATVACTIKPMPHFANDKPLHLC